MITRLYFLMKFYFLEPSPLYYHGEHVFYLAANFEVCSYDCWVSENPVMGFVVAPGDFRVGNNHAMGNRRAADVIPLLHGHVFLKDDLRLDGTIVYPLGAWDCVSVSRRTTRGEGRYARGVALSGKDF